LDFGTEVKQAIHELNVTYREVHKELGINGAFLWEVQNNRYDIGVEKGKALCDYLGLDFDEFLEWSYAYKRIRGLQEIADEIELPRHMAEELQELQSKYNIGDTLWRRRERLLKKKGLVN
jgi:transcriptional regulator with XRE-family HTH domain